MAMVAGVDAAQVHAAYRVGSARRRDQCQFWNRLAKASVGLQSVRMGGIRARSQSLGPYKSDWQHMHGIVAGGLGHLRAIAGLRAEVELSRHLNRQSNHLHRLAYSNTTQYKQPQNSELTDVVVIHYRTTMTLARYGKLLGAGTLTA